jgi:Acetyltransferase (GNAT) domain
MRIDLVAPNGPRWLELLAAVRHDVYHLPRYVALCAQQERGTPYLFAAEEGARRFLVPLIVRPIASAIADADSEYFDATCPYGYPGPLLDPGLGGDANPFLERAIDAFIAVLHERRIVSAFLRLHPLFTLSPQPLQRAGKVIHHGDTVSVDLSLSYEEWWRQTRHNHRRDINRAVREGLVARMDGDWEALDAFVEIYHETMRRLNAADFYYFPRGYFLELREALGGRLHLCIVEIGREVAAAGLFTEACGIVEYHLGATRERFMGHRPAKTMFHFARQWAKARGDRVLHLGGGVGGARDSLFDFKAGFSSVRHPFYTWRVVTDAPVYRALVDRWEDSHGVEANGSDGFFPAYRMVVKPSA